MADPISPEILETLTRLGDAARRASDEFDEFGRELSDWEKQEKRRQAAIDARIDSERKAADERIKAEKEALRKQAEAISKFGNTILSTGRSMTTAEGAFQTMGDVTGNLVKGLSSLAGSIPIIGGVIKGLGEVAGETIKVLTAETGKAFATFGKLSGSGIISSFQDMRDASRETRLTFDQLSSVLTKNSEALGMFGTSALDGSKKLRGVIAVNDKYAESMQNLGIGFQEFAEIQAGYVASQTRAGFARGKSDAALAEGARQYAEELNVLTKLTGKSRETLQQQRDALQNEVKFRSKLIELRGKGDEGKALADTFNTVLTAIPKESIPAIMSLIVNNGAVVDRAAAEMVATYGAAGTDITKIIRLVSTGQMDAATFLKQFGDASKQTSEKLAPLGQILGPEGITKSLVAVDNAALQFADKDIPNIVKGLKTAQDEQKNQKDANAAAAKTAQELAVEMGQLFTNTKSLVTVNHQLGEAMKGLITTINKITGATPTVERPTTPNLAGRRRGTERLGMNRNIYETEPLGGPGVATPSISAPAAPTTATPAAPTTATPAAPTTATPAAPTSVTPAAPSVASAGPSSGPAAADTKTSSPDTSPAGPTSRKISINIDVPLAKIISSKPGELTAETVAGDVQRRVGNANWRMNNPGNLRLTPWTKQQAGVIGEGDAGSSGKFAVFNTLAAGKKAKENLLFGPNTRYSKLSLRDAMYKYAPPSENNTEGYLKSVAAAVGVPDSTLLSQFNQSQRDAMLSSIEKNEGFKIGKIYAAARGGVVEPTPGGTLVQTAEAGQAEAIVPLPDGRTIPVTIKNSGEQIGAMRDMFSSMNQRLDTMIDLLSKGNRVQSNMLANMM